jgi:DNA-binding response OmpR family regulator
MAVLALISDLMMQSQLTAAGKAAGVDVAVVDSENALAEQAERANPKLVIFDLTHPGLDTKALVARLRAIDGNTSTLLAFGPHVHKQRLDEALAAGCDLIATRGQFHSGMEWFLREYGS